jgi:hypothetical protein
MRGGKRPFSDLDFQRSSFAFGVLTPAATNNEWRLRIDLGRYEVSAPRSGKRPFSDLGIDRSSFTSGVLTPAATNNE